MRFLAGEGNLLRHLSFYSYSVTQEQKPIDEFDYSVKDLSSDLRSGVRLARFLERSGIAKDLLCHLRLPDVNIQHRIHNMSLCFEVLREKCGMNFEDPLLVGTSGISSAAGLISPKDIVYGNRDRTLALLWKIVVSIRIPTLVNQTALDGEVETLMSEMDARNSEKLDSLETLYFLSPALQRLFHWAFLVCKRLDVSICIVLFFFLKKKRYWQVWLQSIFFFLRF